MDESTPSAPPKDKTDSGKDAERQKPPWLVFLVALLLAAILLIAFGATVRSTTALVLQGLLGIAGMAGGALIGFLFGIPHTPGTRVRSDTRTQVQASGDAPAPTTGGTTASTATQVTAAGADPGYQPSTNLEQVSDWLTKIIIGVGLVEFTRIGGALADLGAVVSESFGSRPPPGVAVVSQITFVLFAILGFGASYLWTRIYYGEIQTLSDQRVRDLLKPVLASVTKTLERQEARLEAQQSDVQETRARLEAQQSDVRETREKLEAQQSDVQETRELARGLAGGTIVTQAPPAPLKVAKATGDGGPAWPKEVRDRLDAFRNEPVDWTTDPTRAHFGSAPAELNGRALTARIVSNFGNALVINASVVATGERPLEGEVTFVLHPTFPDSVITVAARGDVAEIVLSAREWFTIAAIADNGQTVLSLSLKELEGAPGWFTGA